MAWEQKDVVTSVTSNATQPEPVEPSKVADVLAPVVVFSALALVLALLAAGVVWVWLLVLG